MSSSFVNAIAVFFSSGIVWLTILIIACSVAFVVIIVHRNLFFMNVKVTILTIVVLLSILLCLILSINLIDSVGSPIIDKILVDNAPASAKFIVPPLFILLFLALGPFGIICTTIMRLHTLRIIKNGIKTQALVTKLIVRQESGELSWENELEYEVDGIKYKRRFDTPCREGSVVQIYYDKNAPYNITVPGYDIMHPFFLILNMFFSYLMIWGMYNK